MPILKATLFKALQSEFNGILGLQPTHGEAVKFWKPPFILHRSDIDFDTAPSEIRNLLAREFISSLSDFVPLEDQDGFSVFAQRAQLSDQYEFLLNGATFSAPTGSLPAKAAAQQLQFGLLKQKALDRWDNTSIVGLPNGIYGGLNFHATDSYPSEWWNQADDSLWTSTEVSVEETLPTLDLDDSQLVAIRRRLSQAQSSNFDAIAAELIKQSNTGPPKPGGIATLKEPVNLTTLLHGGLGTQGSVSNPMAAKLSEKKALNSPIGGGNFPLGAKALAVKELNLGEIAGKGMLGSKDKPVFDMPTQADQFSEFQIEPTSLSKGGIKPLESSDDGKMGLEIHGIKIKTPAELEDYFCGNQIRSPIVRRDLGMLLDQGRIQEPVSVDKVHLSFDFCFIRLTRRWLDDQFLKNPNWGIPGVEKGKLQALTGVPISQYVAGAIVIRNLQITFKDDLVDSEALDSAAQFGPFVVERSHEDRSLKFAPCQIIGWHLVPLPSLPPAD